MVVYVLPQNFKGWNWRTTDSWPTCVIYSNKTGQIPSRCWWGCRTASIYIYLSWKSQTTCLVIHILGGRTYSMTHLFYRHLLNRIKAVMVTHTKKWLYSRFVNNMLERTLRAVHLWIDKEIMLCPTKEWQSTIKKKC